MISPFPCDQYNYVHRSHQWAI